MMGLHSRVRWRPLVVQCALFIALLPAHRVFAQAVLPEGFRDELVEGASLPVSMAFLPDGRLLFVEKVSGKIRLIVNDELAAIDPVAVVPDVNTDGGERGLLGVAVDPEWPIRPYVYIHYTSTVGALRISRFRASGDLSFTGNGAISVDLASQFDLINDIQDESEAHNGGTLRFWTDGTLLVTLGEDEVPCAAQDTSRLLGKILRLQTATLPDGPGTATREQIAPPDNPFSAMGGLNARLVWVWGLRNPFSIQVDHASGDMFIADVGANSWEELDQVTDAGLNFGWPGLEASKYFIDCPQNGAPIPPIYAVGHSEGWAAIMVAGVYRRPAGATRPFPSEYEGDLFVADYGANVIRRLTWDGSAWVLATPVNGQPNPLNWASEMVAVSDYAIGPDGSLWYCKHDASQPLKGQIRRIANDNEIWIDNVAQAEGNVGTTAFDFTVRIAVPIDQDVTMDFATTDGPATVLDLDYLNTCGTLTIPANSETATLTIPVIGDLTSEGPETFFVNLSNPSAGVLADAQGQGTILDDDGVTGTEDLIVTDLVLENVRPNPARSVAHVDFAIPVESHVRLSVVDLQGREVAVLVDERRQPGRHTAVWKGRKSPGVYFSRLEAGATVRTRKFLVLE